MERERFESAYEGQPPWDIPGPQPAFARLEAAGMIRGSVLDFIPGAIERAKAKAEERGLDVHFQVGNALKLDQLGRTFDTVIDCGLFHTFADEERPLYVSGLATVVGPGGSVLILCFSDQEPPGQGPRRVTQQEIRDAFRHGWEVVEIHEDRFQTSDHPEARTFSPGGPKAWLATTTRTTASR